MYKQPLNTQTLTKNRDLKLKNFFPVSTTSLHECLEGLNSSVAYSNSELWPYPQGVLFHPGYLFQGKDFWLVFGFCGIIFHPDMLESQSRALMTRKIA